MARNPNFTGISTDRLFDAMHALEKLRRVMADDVLFRDDWVDASLAVRTCVLESEIAERLLDTGHSDATIIHAGRAYRFIPLTNGIREVKITTSHAIDPKPCIFSCSFTIGTVVVEGFWDGIVTFPKPRERKSFREWLDGAPYR